MIVMVSITRMFTAMNRVMRFANCVNLFITQMVARNSARPDPGNLRTYASKTRAENQE
jgi:hypothetical protein